MKTKKNKKKYTRTNLKNKKKRRVKYTKKFKKKSINKKLRRTRKKLLKQKAGMLGAVGSALGRAKDAAGMYMFSGEKVPVPQRPENELTESVLEMHSPVVEVRGERNLDTEFLTHRLQFLKEKQEKNEEDFLNTNRKREAILGQQGKESTRDRRPSLMEPHLSRLNPDLLQAREEARRAATSFREGRPWTKPRSVERRGEIIKKQK